MNFVKSKAILKKINALHNSAESFEGKMSKMEKDLLLHYLRELYEIVGEDSSPASVEPVKEMREKAPVKEPYIEDHRYDRKEEIVRTSEMRYEAPIETSRVKNGKPKKVFIDDHPKAETLKNVDEALTSLFDVKEGKDHGSRYSNLPISDIAKSMGINDRILTINELFKGDQSLFNKVVSKLNGFSNFDEAKEYLISGIGQKNDWASGRRKEKAEAFIKLIKRRYL